MINSEEINKLNFTKLMSKHFISSSQYKIFEDFLVDIWIKYEIRKRVK